MPVLNDQEMQEIAKGGLSTRMQVHLRLLYCETMPSGASYHLDYNREHLRHTVTNIADVQRRAMQLHHHFEGSRWIPSKGMGCN
jgi:hypothetical protein